MPAPHAGMSRARAVGYDGRASREVQPVRAGLLVASPQMMDLFFSKTVVLLCDYDEEGALGIVLNRLTGLDTEKVLSQIEIPSTGALAGPVRWGGPVQPGAVFLTFACSQGTTPTGDGVYSIGKSIAVSPSRDAIQAVAADPTRPRAFLSLGYAGWAPGQLDGEIQSGSWIFMEADEGIVFDTPAEQCWQRCIDSLGVDPSLIWMQPISE